MTRSWLGVGVVLVALWGVRASPAAEGEERSAVDVNALAVEIAALLAESGATASSAEGDGESKASYADVIKGMEEVKMTQEKSLFTLWRHPRKETGKDQETLLCEVPARMLDRRFMLSTAVSGGSYLFGFPLNERVVLWKVQGDNLLLVEPQTRFQTAGSTPVRAAVERTHPDLVLASVPILARNPQDESPVFDLGALLKSEFADVGWVVPRGFSRILPTNSTFEKVKPFPQNVEIAVKLAVTQPRPPGSYRELGVHYSFWALPETGYTPRVADSRVGYFLTTHQDWSTPVEARSLWKRYIDRWQLEKRDPTLARSEPKVPIIFYIERSWPVAYREAARSGILEWNKAFEAIGFLNAIEVRQQEADNEWADIDLEDMRYSGLRWITTGWAFAMGPHRANPFTGQIYDADILFDDSMVRAFAHDADVFSSESMLAPRLADQGLQQFWKSFPGLKPRFAAQNFAWQVGIACDEQEERGLIFERYRSRHHFGQTCGVMQGMQTQMRFAGTVLASKPPEVRQRLIQEAIKETVAHEVGHALGLRHNFAGSTVYDLKTIAERAKKSEPTSGSVMDYLPLMFGHDHECDGHFTTPTIGTWDRWAISYGYQPFDSSYRGGEDKPETGPPGSEEGGKEPGRTAAADQLELPAEMLAVMEKLSPEVRESARKILIEAGIGSIVSSAEAAKPAKVAQPPAGEEAMLRQIAARASEPELVYQTDEDTTLFGLDPRANVWDLGDDPLEWAQIRIELIDKRLADFLDWAVKDGESWEYARNSLFALMFEKVLVLDYVGKLIGGQYVSRSHRGDDGAPRPFVLIPKERQEEALRFIAERLYSDAYLELNSDLLQHLPPSRWSHDGAWVALNLEFPAHGMVALWQWWSLFERLFPPTLQRMHDAELKAPPEDRFTVSAYLRALQEACWKASLDVDRASSSQEWNDTHAFVPDVRRSLQREYLALHEQLVRYQPGDVLSPDLHALVRQTMSDLKGKIEKVLAVPGLDLASRAHLETCRFRIDAVLNPRFEEHRVWQ